MKIVYCIPSIISAGGIERILAIKANYLTDILGYEIIIVTTDNGSGVPFFYLSSKIKIFDIGVAYEGYNFISKVINRLVQRRKLRAKLRKLLFEIKPDITISMFNNEAPFLPSIKDGSVKILENHSCRYYRILRSTSFVDKLYSRIRFYNDAKIVKKYDAFVTLTQEDKMDWPSYPNIYIIPNPLTIRCNEKANFKGKRVIAVGRIYYAKGFDNLVRAWSIVERKHPDWELLIVGSHDDIIYVNYIKDLIQSLKLRNVLLRPPSKAIEEEYLKSNIMVMTSNYEGLPLVLIEGMSVGLPLVAFDCKCGPSDIIKDGKNGFLVKDKNIDAFAAQICHLIEDKELHMRMSANALECSKLYDIENIMNRWTSLFEKLLESKVITK